MNRLPAFAHLLLGGGVLSLLTKVSLLLILAALVAAVARGASAAFRHLIWTLSLGGCVALAVITPAAPSVVIRVPDVVSTAPIVPIARPTSIPAAAVRHAISTSASAVASEPRVGAPRDAAAWMARNLAVIVVGLWVVGCIAVLARCVAGHLAVTRLVARSRPASAWHVDALRALLAEARIDRPVRLLVSPTVTAPITCGVFRPLILVPSDVDEWSDERRRVVLLHELAHVVRLDYAAQLVGTVACGLFWFHPGVWLAAARLRAESELAADDRVLAAGTSGLNYATHLLEVARGGLAMRLSAGAAVGMARSTHLEGRFRAMLDSKRSRASVSTRMQLVAGGLAILALVPLAGLRTEAVAALARRQHQSVLNRPLTSETRVTPTAVDRSSTVAVATTVASVVDTTFEQTIGATPGERLWLELPTGGEVIVQGWDERRVRVRALLGGRNWRETRVALERVAGGVRLRSRFDRPLEETSASTSHTFELWVPRQFNVQLSSAGGGVAIRDVSGDFRGYTGGGAIEIERASGRASLTTGGGNVVVWQSDLAGWVRSGTGPEWSSGVDAVNVGIAPGVAGGVATTGSPAQGYVSAQGVSTAVSSSGIATGYSQNTSISTTTASPVIGGVSGFPRAVIATVPPGVASTVPGGVIGGVQGGVAAAAPGSVGVSGTIAALPGQQGGYVTSIPEPGTRPAQSMATTVTSDRVGDLSAVTVTSGQNSRGIHVSKPGGPIDVGDAPEGGVLFTGGGDIYVGSSGAFLSATTGGGDVDLRRVAGDANINTGAGTVTVRVVNDDGRVHSVIIRSGNGRVDIDLPADLDARIDIETAYTENFVRATRIDSDFALQHSETPTWDTRVGTPRRYVRAQGVVGNGRGLINIRTVNGDVTVRRGP